MKERIIHFFKHDRSYAGGVKLYNEFGTLISLKKQLNVQEENQHLNETLFEALRELAGISIDEFRGIMLAPVEPIGDPQGNPPAPAKKGPAKAASRKSDGSGKSKDKGKSKAPKKGKTGGKSSKNTNHQAKESKPAKPQKDAGKANPPDESPSGKPTQDPNSEK